MPENAAPVKVERTARWGAEIVRCGNSSEQRRRAAAEIRDERGLEVHPAVRRPRIIAGQGTVGLEIVSDLPEVATVVVCIGGGGLISGIATAVKTLRPGVRVVGVEPELAADAQASFREGRIVTWPAADVARTICDGVRSQALGQLTFASITALVDEIVTVSDDAVLDAMRWLALEAKLLVEPTGALTVAAALSGAVQPEGPTVLVLSGGNASRRCSLACSKADAREACRPAGPGGTAGTARRDRRAPWSARSGPRADPSVVGLDGLAAEDVVLR